MNLNLKSYPFITEQWSFQNKKDEDQVSFTNSFKKKNSNPFAFIGTCIKRSKLFLPSALAIQ